MLNITPLLILVSSPRLMPDTIMISTLMVASCATKVSMMRIDTCYQGQLDAYNILCYQNWVACYSGATKVSLMHIVSRGIEVNLMHITFCATEAGFVRYSGATKVNLVCISACVTKASLVHIILNWDEQRQDQSTSLGSGTYKRESILKFMANCFKNFEEGLIGIKNDDFSSLMSSIVKGEVKLKIRFEWNQVYWRLCNNIKFNTSLIMM